MSMTLQGISRYHVSLQICHSVVQWLAKDGARNNHSMLPLFHSSPFMTYFCMTEGACPPRPLPPQHPPLTAAPPPAPDPLFALSDTSIPC